MPAVLSPTPTQPEIATGSLGSISLSSLGLSQPQLSPAPTRPEAPRFPVELTPLELDYARGPSGAPPPPSVEAPPAVSPARPAGSPPRPAELPPRPIVVSNRPPVSQARPPAPPRSALNPTPSDVRSPWRRRGPVTGVALAVVATIIWARWIPDFVVTGQPLGQGRAAVVMLQGADQPLALFRQQVNQLAASSPDMTFVMANAQRAGDDGRRWINGPNWEDVAATKADAFHQIDAVLARLRAQGVKDADLYLGGFDEGGQVALDYATRHIQAPAGLILLSAGMPPWELGDLRAFDPARVFIAHGETAREANAMGSTRVANLLRAEGARVRVLNYVGGRELPPDAMTELTGFIDAHR